MARKIDTNPEKIINEIINRYNNDINGIFQKLFDYDNELTTARPRHLFSVNDCKTVLREYNLPIPYPIRELQMEVLSECLLLLLYNWQKCKVIYHMNISKHIDMPNEYVSPKVFNKFPYPGFYVDYNFTNSEYYGVFVTCYREQQEMEIGMQNRILLGYVMYDANNMRWTIEPIVFDVKNNISIIDSIMRTMNEIVVFVQERILI